MKNPVSGCYSSAALVVALLLFSPHLSAWQFTADAGLNVDHSDNIFKSDTNEESDQIVTAQVGGTITENSGPLTGSATATARQLEYLDNSFGSQTWLGLNSSATWDQIRGRLTWDIHDYFSQNQINSLGVDTPDNTENLNAFGIAANLFVPLADRQRLSLTPSFQDYYYETSDVDNQKFGLTGGWNYQWRPTITVNAYASVEETDFDDDTIPDFSRKSARAGFSGKRARSTFDVSLGLTRVDRDSGGDSDGVSGIVDWTLELSGRSLLRTHLASDITDSSYEFLGTATDPATGNISNVQTAGDAVRSRVARITYTRSGASIDTTLWTEQRGLDYRTSAVDRDVQEYGARLDFLAAQQIFAALQARFTRIEETQTQIDQDTRELGASLGYRLTRKMSVNVGVSQNSRDSNQAGADYDEFRVTAGLGYRILP